MFSMLAILVYEPIRSQCILPVPPENIRKPSVFTGYRKSALGTNGLTESLKKTFAKVITSFHL